MRGVTELRKVRFETLCVFGDGTLLVHLPTCSVARRVMDRLEKAKQLYFGGNRACASLH